MAGRPGGAPVEYVDFCDFRQLGRLTLAEWDELPAWRALMWGEFLRIEQREDKFRSA